MRNYGNCRLQVKSGQKDRSVAAKAKKLLSGTVGDRLREELAPRGTQAGDSRRVASRFTSTRAAAQIKTRPKARFVMAEKRLLCAANVERASFATFGAIEVTACFAAHLSARAGVGLAHADHGCGFFGGTGSDVHSSAQRGVPIARFVPTDCLEPR